MPIAIRSFREQFPDCELIVVDNNPTENSPNWTARCRQEQLWIRTEPGLIVVENPTMDRSAGRGIDLALEVCRNHGHDVMIHIEPDCLVSGKTWLKNLLVPMESGAWMSGSLRRFYGPIHPTPSAWKCDINWSSFAHAPRGDDIRHPRFAELFQLTQLVEWSRDHEPDATQWWSEYWDCAQRNWFLAARSEKAVLVEPTDDFEHFWYGSMRSPDPGDPRFAKYLPS